MCRVTYPKKHSNMTKRILPLLALLFLFTTTASAQFEFGLKAGLSTESLQGQELRLSGESVENLGVSIKDANYGIQAGAFFRIFLGENVFLQPEFTFNSTSAEFSVEDPDGDFIFKEKYNFVDVPLLLGYKLGFLKLSAGPVGHFYFDQPQDIINRDGWESALDEFNLGYALGGAIDIGKMTFDVRYDGNFGKFGQTFTVAGNEFAVDQAPKRWVATVGYRF